MTDSVGKWAVGNSYGPVLTQTDLYMLDGVDLELHPILSATDGGFQLIFNIVTGSTTGYSADARDRDIPFTAKDEPATLPRVDQLIIVTDLSPWCTIVKNPQGVTLSDVCTTLWRDYTDNAVTDKELEVLPPRVQDQIKRFASGTASSGWSAYYSPAPTAVPRLKRADWLRERQYFEKLHKRDSYVKQRLGYSAPNIFVLSLSQYY
ncbi:hypothetical protein IEO21_07840 [Rhodonia placenta]|uniref:DUF6699 domain-containing protein n=2 Tax=Rhodonia placenta TaxID=104341 RepID=A0A1X6MJP0_9APHY|nr:hypothetical protein POSPLADRAFT_1042002 [Postia placenta MAD-698-R-SB12]KAF9808548.1 hypothetical protein IEO21_07840 [Postia placenta]OSX56253.1 hypothetical protein POSPLADRAFT_1042002 [Postia placenta MAD-698-R-SB12]